MMPETKVVLNIIEAMKSRVFYKIDKKPLYDGLDDVIDKVFRKNGYSEDTISSIRKEVIRYLRFDSDLPRVNVA